DASGDHGQIPQLLAHLFSLLRYCGGRRSPWLGVALRCPSPPSSLRTTKVRESTVQLPGRLLHVRDFLAGGGCCAAAPGALLVGFTSPRCFSRPFLLRAWK